MAGAKGPILPFETSSQALRFNDEASRISDARIKRLLRSGPILGDRVLLQNDLAVYFPDGFIVSSKAEFHQYRPVEGLMPEQVRAKQHLEPSPRYDTTANFDAVLGPVCASLDNPRIGPGAKMDMRINASGVISVVIDTPGRFDSITGENSRSYTVVSAVDTAFLGDPGTTRPLMATCSQQAQLTNR